jgi:hypothetical protein
VISQPLFPTMFSIFLMSSDFNMMFFYGSNEKLPFCSQNQEGKNQATFVLFQPSWFEFKVAFSIHLFECFVNLRIHNELLGFLIVLRVQKFLLGVWLRVHASPEFHATVHFLMKCCWWSKKCVDHPLG